jgi:hypothetical protein
MSLCVILQPIAKKSAIALPGPRHAGNRKDRVWLGQRAQDEIIPPARAPELLRYFPPSGRITESMT